MQSMHITTYVASSNPAQERCTRYNQHYMIKFVRDLRQVGWGTPDSSTNKTYLHDITEILSKVALNTIPLP